MEKFKFECGSGGHATEERSFGDLRAEMELPECWGKSWFFLQGKAIAEAKKWTNTWEEYEEYFGNWARDFIVVAIGYWLLWADLRWTNLKNQDSILEHGKERHFIDLIDHIATLHFGVPKEKIWPSP